MHTTEWPGAVPLHRPSLFPLRRRLPSSLELMVSLAAPTVFPPGLIGCRFVVVSRQKGNTVLPHDSVTCRPLRCAPATGEGCRTGSLNRAQAALNLWARASSGPAIQWTLDRNKCKELTERFVDHRLAWHCEGGDVVCDVMP